MVGNSLLRQKIGIPMGTDPAPFSSELVSNSKVKACHFHATKRFIDDVGTLNDGGALFFCYIYF